MKQSKLHAMTVAAGAIVLGSALIAAPAMAKTKTEHLRGEIGAVSDSGFTVKTDDGSMRKVALGSDTKIAGVVPSSLDQVEQGTFIGTANVKRDGQARALEAVVFPESMKGTGLGDYAWDLSPSDVKGGDSGMSMGSGSSMTNGTVQSSGSASADNDSGMSMGGGSSMTNGTVTRSSGDSKMSVKVDYGKGSKMITIPKDVPVVALQKGSKSDIKKGEHVFVAGPQGTSPFQAKIVLVGIDGTVPPM